MSKHLNAFYKLKDDITLTEVRKDDIPALIEHINDKAIYDNTLTIPFPYTDKDGHLFVDLCRKFEEHHHHICNYAIRKSGKLIGGIGFLYNYGVESHRSEFGYWIGSTYRNKGIMTAVIKTFIEIAFEDKQLFRLEANVFPENEASRHVLEKTGFINEGLQKSTFVKEDRLRDTYLYAIIREVE